eukprot:g3319.t1
MAQRTHYYDTDADQVQLPSETINDADPNMLTSKEFYVEYHGHSIPHLKRVLNQIKYKNRSLPRPTIYLVGDSTMDNKYWLGGRGRKALNGYENLFKTMKPDVSYFVNKYCKLSNSINDHFCINAAIEESTLNDRPGETLMSHDKFVRDHIQPEDILICSVGGNDIALKPTCGTIFNIALLLKLNTYGMIDSGWAVGLGHFIKLFKDETTKFLMKICAKNKPKLILVNCIYYLDEKKGDSWADGTLNALGYNDNPEKLQLCIRKIFEFATSKIEIDGTKVVAVPMFEILNGKNTQDYVARVEPSIQGGEKLGKAFVKYIEETCGGKL